MNHHAVTRHALRKIVFAALTVVVPKALHAAMKTVPPNQAAAAADTDTER